MAVAERRPPRPAGRGWLIAASVLIVVAALVGLYLLAVLSWSYSDGERVGILQKFSRKGWICKTYEGELALFIIPGVAPTIWLLHRARHGRWSRTSRPRWASTSCSTTGNIGAYPRAASGTPAIS